MRRVPRTLAAALVVAAAAACATHAIAAGGATTRPSAPASASSPAGPPAAADAAAGFRSPRKYADIAAPVRLRIPAIGVDSTIQRLGLDADGAIAAPGFQNAGWYEAGPRPGQPGPAILLGHYDTRTGPAVFYRLPELGPGAQVLVDRADGSTVRFRIQGRMQVAKSRFPADLVYGPTLTPSLRLVTCGGTFDPRTGHYRDNVVLTAVPAGSRR